MDELFTARRQQYGQWRSLVSALHWGCKGRRFESSLPDQVETCRLSRLAGLAIERNSASFAGNVLQLLYQTYVRWSSIFRRRTLPAPAKSSRARTHKHVAML